MHVRAAQGLARPGQITTMRGTLGPNTTGAPIDLVYTGKLPRGAFYRDVVVEPGGDCTVERLSFMCAVTLAPGAAADIRIRFLVDTVMEASSIRQQFAVDSANASIKSAMTSTTRVDDGEDRPSPDALGAFTVTEFPGATLPLLSMFLYSLAASSASAKKRARQGGSALNLRRKI